MRILLSILLILTINLGTYAQSIDKLLDDVYNKQESYGSLFTFIEYLYNIQNKRFINEQNVSKDTLDNYNIHCLILLDEGYNNYAAYINPFFFKSNKSIEQDYINIYKKDYEIINKNKSLPTAYHYEGITFELKDIPDFIFRRRQYISTYKNSRFNKILEIEINHFILDFMDDKNYVWNYDKEQVTLKKDTQIIYECFLNNYNSNTKEYILIKAWYNVLKCNNFILNDNVNKFLQYQYRLLY